MHFYLRNAYADAPGRSFKKPTINFRLSPIKVIVEFMQYAFKLFEVKNKV